MKALVLLYLIALVSLFTGCASVQNAGTAEYTVRPFLDAGGSVHCCEIRVVNGKEIALLEAHVAKQGDNYTVDLKEQGVVAFEGQRIAAGAMQAAIDAAAKAATAATAANLTPMLAPMIPGLRVPQ